jgi:glycosyltransferase involved in cell wall biosynthesis
MNADQPDHGQQFVFVNRYYRPDQSATSQMLTDLAQGLGARRMAVHVLCSRQLYDDPNVRLVPDELLQGVHVHRVRTTRFGRHRLLGRAVDYVSFYASCAFTLVGLLHRGDVLIAKTDPPLLSILVAPIARLKGATLVNWQQDVFPEVASHLGSNPLPPWLDRCLRRLRDSSLRSARINVLIGSRMREYFISRGIAAEKLCVIENWADDQAIVPKPTEASELRRRLGFRDKFVVCYSGNLGRAHEYETMLAAAEALRLESVFVFLIIGGGAKTESLKQAVASRKLDNFRFLPYQPRESLADSLAAADVHLVSLLPVLEGLIVPSKLYGILAAGRPVVFIGDPDGDTARVVRGAQCGSVVGMHAAHELAAALRELNTQPALRDAMGMRARQVFSEKYAVTRAIERWMNVLEPTPANRASVVPPQVLSNR